MDADCGEARALSGTGAVLPFHPGDWSATARRHL